MDARARRTSLLLAGILAAGFVLRLAYVLGQRGDLLFDYPVVDEETYVSTARLMAQGRELAPRPWFHPPGMVYALSVIFQVAGPGLLLPRLVQVLVSTASCLLAYLVARRFFGEAVALGTAAVCAVHGVLVFETYELLPPTWMLAADLLALWLLLRAGDRRTPGAALAAGAALGVAAVFGPTILPFALVAAWWLRRPPLVGALLLGLALPIAPVTAGNWQRSHEVVLVSTNGGINFFLGNNDDYDRALAIRPGPHWEALEAEPQRAGVVGASAASSWFYGRGLAFWREHPLRAAALYVRKLYLYFDGPEIPRDTDLKAMSAESPLLRILVTHGPPWLPDGALVPLALVGMALSWRDRRRLLVPYAFVAVQALVLAAFFVTSRYRVPALPVLAMFACAGAVRALEAWRSGRGAARVVPAAACVALAVPLNVATRESSVSYGAELDFYRGMELRTYLHDPRRAIDFFQRAASQDPGDARAWFELGQSLEAVGRTDEALDAWRRAAQADPWDARARRRMAVVLAARGDLDGAIATLDADIATRAHDDAFYAPDHMNLSLMCARRGLLARAVDELHAAERSDPKWFRANVRGFARTALSTPGVDDPAFRQALVKAAGGP